MPETYRKLSVSFFEADQFNAFDKLTLTNRACTECGAWFVNNGELYPANGTEALHPYYKHAVKIARNAGLIS